ncbi:TetR/AcrR family transcriptional regulator [Aestuariispira ectoiniformans]|uniref:TetR/AcrR family transcriptional regulator n=1 Tax=Aestuariispira ectoiniformans TaxID=2775080 RepID=UPI00223C17E3|nr:TetR/AcrR family transcriptional regulator [Aestuariispira ectoiniformans]
MSRPKKIPDARVLDIALRMIQTCGPASLTFAALAKESGLSAATLVQRFQNKEGLVRASLLHAWDRLDTRTEDLAGQMPKTPAGAVDILVALSGDCRDAESYSDSLLVLREDFRDPVLRRRGVAWKEALSARLEACFEGTPAAPDGIGSLLFTQWQGTVLWWGFEPDQPVDDFVRQNLERFVATLLG